ncbi:uncharacterized protein [Aegilops tauschii subsp. strangulata]|uniref:uncharacterized protein n=1 Tax=Aegilops tauschii subsp. strangulata TaxID=200361 RepID=UPI003CC87D84
MTFKPSPQSRFIVDEMEAFQERMLKEFAKIRAAQSKLLAVDGLSAQLEALDAKLTEQGARLDQVQVKVDLSCNTLSQVQQSQAHVVQMHKQQGAPEMASPTASEVSDGILGAGPRSVGRPPPPPIQVPEVQHGPYIPLMPEIDENLGKRQWMPKRDFPRFDGTEVRIWLDKCEAFFRLYHIPDSFRVTSASLYLSENAARWYQAFKQSGEFHTWEQFRQAILLEFDVDVYRQKMKELMLLKQVDTVEEYKQQFLQLVYTVKLYEPTISDTFLVTRFVLGLKEELRSAVELQIPRTKTHKTSAPKTAYTKSDSRSGLAAGELWKAKQLKEYCRANGLCYKCGEKFVPGHVCNQNAAGGAQLKAAEVLTTQEIISDTVLDALVAGAQAECATISVNALSGAQNPKTIQLRALVQNKVVLILVDSGSTHTFVDKAFLEKISVTAEPLVTPLQVKVANGSVISCTEKVSQLTWWMQGHSFSNSMQYQGKEVRLQGVLPVQQENIEEISADQLLKWEKGNEVWATALLNRIVVDPVTKIPQEVKQVLDRNKQVFQEPTTLPPHRAFDHKINLVPDAAPVNCRPYRYSPLQKDEIEKQVREMLDTGLITPSISPFAAPVLLVKKKDGTWRLCVDYRKLNAITVKNKFPMPVIDEILDELGGAKWFSKLDLRAGYHQIRMKEEHEYKTTFKTHHGRFQFRVMPFGLATAPGTFQCVMNFAFAGANRKYVLVFMDDILVFSGTLEEHIEHLQSVCDILKENQLFVKESVSTDPTKTEAMLQWPVPTSVTELRGFLGLTGYYRKFVRNYGLLAKPLTALLKKQAFVWSEAAQQAFELLKQAMEGLLKEDSKIWIGANEGLKTKLIQAFHSTPVGGHSGILPTYHRVKQLFSWRGMRTYVENFVKQCGVCQQAKHELCKSPGLLQPLPIPDSPWQAISMDFIEGLPKSEGYSAILVVVDRFTKVSHFLPLKHPFTAASVANIFLNNIVKLHGLPLAIVSDRDKIFTSSFWKELFRIWGTELQMSTAYHPQTDGQTERVNQCLEMYLRKLALQYFGPYKILDKVGNAAYRLELPRGSQVHPVFHVSQLKSHVPDHTPVFTTLPVPIDLSVPGVVPEEILDRRLVKKGNASHLQILVKWSKMPAASATWEDYEVIKERFPAAPAWGHAGSSGAGTVSAEETTTHAIKATKAREV